MKLETTRLVQSSAVRDRVDVTFSVIKDEANELRKALSIVQKYEKEAIDAIREDKKGNPRLSDWAQVSYCVKNDQVIVSVEHGMAG